MLMPLQGNHHTTYNTQGVALGYLFFGPPGRWCTDELLINPNLRYDGLVTWRLWCQRHFLLLGNNMKIPDKNLSGKSDEREVKICKNQFFTLHSSSFISRKHSFGSAKHKLWPRQRPCFIAWNITFHTTKPYLSRNETLPFANLDFVNRQITDK